MLIVMNKSSHEKHLTQPLQTNNEQFEKKVTFLTGYNGIFNIINRKNNFYFTVSINDDDFNVNFVSPGAYELDCLDKESIRITFKDGYFTDESYPFVNKTYCSTLGSIMIIKPNFIGTQFSFALIDSIRHLLEFDSAVLNGNNILSQNPVDILSFDKNFPETDDAQGVIF